MSRKPESFGREVKESERDFQFAEIRFGGPGHESEYTMHIEGYDQNKYIPRGFEDELCKRLPPNNVSNRGTRVEIYHYDESKKPCRDDVLIYRAVSESLADFAEKNGYEAYKLGPYGWEIARAWLIGEFGEAVVDNLTKDAVYDVPSQIPKEQAQKLLDTVETLWELVLESRRAIEDSPSEDVAEEQRKQVLEGITEKSAEIAELREER